ncbi:MAG: hypothetical protein EBS53_00830 [Bacteroidetes bacterium]|nr:hypothetical protein [Bacteroidota bacterium]
MSQHLGAIAVTKISSVLLEHGFLVSTPVYDNGYDLITDYKGVLKRVQVKSSSGTEDGVKGRTKLKFYALRGTGFQQTALKRIYGRNEVDAFIFYNTKQNAVFVVPFDKLPRTQSVYFALNCEWRENWDVLRVEPVKKSGRLKHGDR